MSAADVPGHVELARNPKCAPSDMRGGLYQITRCCHAMVAIAAFAYQVFEPANQ